MTKVLVVDDETSITEGLLALFDLESIEAVSANDRKSAEAMITENFYPVILADLRLVTEADGLQLLESIRQLSPRSKVASLTAFATPEVEAELLRLGSTMVLRKPMGFDEIISIVGEMLETIEGEAIAQQARTQQPVDLVQLYSDVQRVLFSIPQRKYGLTSEETEELVQEAWCLYLQKQHNILMPRPWLAGTIVNLCKQQIHSKSRSRETTREITTDTEELVETRGAANDSVMMVQQGLGRLDDRSRKLCVLIGMEGWSYDEVSDELGIPIGSVGPLYIRAKNKLKKALTATH